MTDKVSVEIYETQIFKSVFHPISNYTFGLSFLTTLDKYKDYFKSHQRWHKLHKCWAKFCSSKLWPEIEFVLVHLSCEEADVFVHCRVLWPSNFMIFIVWWTEKLCSQHPSLVGDQVTYWDLRNWLVTRNRTLKMTYYYYKTSPIGYWGKCSTVGWYKVLGFL